MYQFVKFIQASRLKGIITRGGNAGNNMDFITGSHLAEKELIFLDEEDRSRFNSRG